jgi:hypothetical protein
MNPKTSAIITACVVAITLLGSTSCKSQPSASESNLTAGMAKKTIVKGQTSQAEVLEVFGPPDLVTHKDDLQVWTWDKIRYDVSSSGSYLTVLIAGVGGQRTTSSSQSTMLIIYFDSQDIVRDYRLSVVKF